MRILMVPMALFLVAVGDVTQAGRWSFEDAQVGQLPPGWQAAQTGKGKGSVWKVVADKTAPKGTRALAQQAESPGTMYNLCLADKSVFKDGEIAVAFKAVQGETDQGGGPLWRCQDGNNYYIARYNPLEKNFRLYKIVGGKRVQLASKADLALPAGVWHTIRIRHVGDEIDCYLNGVKHLTARDDALPKAGKIGLWTKADAQTYFADVRVEASR